MKFSSFRYLFKEGLKNIRANKMMSFASIGVLVSCFLLTGLAVLFSVNVGTVMEDIGSQNAITVYLKDSVPTLQAVEMGETFKEIDNVLDVEFISKQQALEQYREELGPLFEDLEAGENFLPDAYRITMKDLSRYDETVAKITAVEGVDTYNDRIDAAEKLTDLDNLVTTAGLWIVVILGLISLFILCNTIRITMYSRRMQINIMQSVGATNSFICMPFLVEGAVLGILSALLSTVLLGFLYRGVISVIQNILPFDALPFFSMGWMLLLAFLGFGILFGILGGVISIHRYLKNDRNAILNS